MDYDEFLASKQYAVTPVGFDPRQVSTLLYPFQADLVRWAARLGRAAIFSDCGTGKTLMQLEWARLVSEYGAGPVLILAPLAVAKQTVREAEKLGVVAGYCRKQADMATPIVVANYEMLEHFDPSQFVGVVLDESSILKSYDGATRTAIIDAFRTTPFKLACTATPAPNDFMELGNHAEFLGVMTRPEMLAMFFAHDGGSTADWRIKGHAERDFWRWVCRWAAMVRKPSDLGYPDGAFVLPPLHMVDHVVDVDHRAAWKAGSLFQMEAQTLQERRDARRGSIDERVAKAAELVNSKPGQWLVWCGLNREGDALEAAIDGAVQVSGSDTAEHKEKSMIDFAEGRLRVLVSKVSICGFGMNFQSCANMAFVGLSDSYEQLYQAIRRCWRFGQTQPVYCHVITSETEGAVVDNIRRKEEEAGRMADGMVEHMREFVQANVRGTKRDETRYQPAVAMTIPAWLESESM